MLKKAGIPEWIVGPILAILIFLMGFIVGSSPNPGETTEQKNPIKPYDTAGYYYSYYLVRDWFAKDAAGFFTALLFIIASGQAGLFYIQLRLMRDGLNDAKIAAIASRDSALATRDAVDLAKITARRQLRAYLVVEKCTIDYISGKASAKIKIRNCGQTPADRIMVVTSIDPLHRPATIIRPVDINTIPKGRLGSGHMTIHEVKRAVFDDADTAGLDAKTHWISVGGDVEYTDIFGTTWVLPFEFVTGGKFGPIVRGSDLQPSTEAKQEYEKGVS